MSEDNSYLKDTRPLGKSVEEIERDSQNLINPPAIEQHGPGQGVAAVPPVNSTGTWPSQTAIGASTPEVPMGPVPRRDDD
ncbi:hypothetical protein GCM10008955_32090 [Deinococcus malanensis]|uniref:Uncharacterized protein n=1 Tax=Deinococcus malanensis TaxID=1706855 RepID=A0ABQ2F347_9DEIO|nr:hypothetical protein [Deinococcus malanensis]GGK35727.1 hypothetical protein GCM10008955_32090 [Deinococcus malanensis]